MMIILFVIILILTAILMLLTVYSVGIYKKAISLTPINKTREELMSEVKQYMIQNEGLKKENELLNGQVIEAKNIINKKEEMEEYIRTYQGDYEDKKREIQRLDDNIEEISKDFDKINTEYEEAVQKRNDTLEENASLVVQNTMLTEKIAANTTEKNRLDGVIENLHTEINNLNVKKTALETQIAQLQTKAKEIQDKEKTLADLNHKIELASEDLVKHLKELEKAKIQHGQLTAPEEVEKQRWEDLDRPILTKNLNRCSNINEEAWLTEFESTLEDNDIVFDERTIKAFHTGLKSEDISPMVVLSGISGTGKSLLPQLYAHASGMNFLQVAVQPRWDSPQDMLGFYNYMQNKFKATELSRLLWENDIYNNNVAYSKYSGDRLKLPMNLVLLDEMNLARVEYYFSDLLSKLEVRRTIGINDLTDADRRMAAEIEIECGAIGKKETARRLYINGNTLFVGTMNEDETTQNLSDKVMDRSNVLRFGKPKKLENKPNIDGFKAYYKHDNYLDYKTWSNWCDKSHANPNFESKLRSYINPLLDSFAEIGRPFAHRVWQSISTYVSVYPGSNTDTGFKHAVADQVEMKLLPKLNGLDLSDSKTLYKLKEIKNIIDRLNDEKLSDAYNRSMDPNTNIFFTWKGVIR